ncbi:phosphoglycerate dehydrogenase [Auriculariales sp. MPI-PUGE-AT-0066]|nr:phosphoglycerate dehydrogenase [Auriculariales sp. MPI-PUGE-AT-0066]
MAADPVILELEGMYSEQLLEDTLFGPTGYIYHTPRLGLDLPTTDVPADIRHRTEGLFMFRRFLPAEEIALFPNLKVVVRMGVGYDRLDRITLAQRGVKVCNIPDYGTTEVADHALALALALRRGVLLHHELQRASPPAPWVAVDSPLIQRPSGPTAPLTNRYAPPRPRTFGVLGLGRIGTAAALRAKAFGWRVVFFDPYLPNGVDRSFGFVRCLTIEELFRQSDTLSLHTPLTNKTRGLVDERLLRLMPAGAVLINTSRGPVVDLDGLHAVLRDSHLAGAGLDVVPQEEGNYINQPDAVVHPLIDAYRKKEDWLVGRLVISPHSAFHSADAWEDIRSLSAETMKDVLIDGKNTNVIPPDAE